MAYFCYPLVHLFHLRHSVLSPCFRTLLVIRFTSGCSQLPFTLCVVATLLSISLCVPVCVERETQLLAGIMRKCFQYNYHRGEVQMHVCMRAG